MILHVDVNSAFLSWESVYRLRFLNETLDLRTVPSAVGGDREQRQGIILAKSIPAKAFGVQTAEPIAVALRKCPDLVIVPPRFDFYKECSHAFIDILCEYTDTVEQFSIDEAFMDMSESAVCKKDPMAFAEMLRNRIRDELGFTVNIGVAENKLLAKTASDFKKPDRCHSLFNSEITTKFWPLPVSDLLFVGASTAHRLGELGIRTIGALAHTDPGILASHFGKTAGYLVEASNGIDDSAVSTEHSEAKGYSHAVTLQSNVTDAEEAHRILLSLCESVCIRLRRHDTLVTTLAVSIRDSSFSTHSHQMKLPAATNITSEMYEHACRLFDRSWDSSPIRQLGVHASGVTDDDLRQLTFFDTGDFSRRAKADKVMDSLREKFGHDAVTRGSLIKKHD